MGAVDFCGVFPQLVPAPPPVSPSGLLLYTPEQLVSRQKFVVYDPIYIGPLLPQHVKEAGVNLSKVQAEQDGVPAYKLWLAPDALLKAGISGGGQYFMLLPSAEMDSTFFDETHNALFVDYLRICFRWGGLPSFEDWPEDERPHELLATLTADLLPL